MSENPSSAAVVVYDPSDNHFEGAVVRGPEIARVQARGVIALDCDAALVEAPTAAGMGYVRRGLGAGVVVDSFARGHGPQLVAPVLIRTFAGDNRLHWAALLRREGAEVGHAHGTLRLGVGPLDSGRAPALRTTAHVQLDQLTNDDDAWIVQGRAVATTETPLALPLVLSAVGRGVRVMWLAVGQR